MNKKKLIVIDANSVIHRAFHALPSLSTKKGEAVGGVYGFLLVFFRALKEFNPDFIVACFDFPAPTFRHKKYKEYKAKRPPAPEELYSQIPKVKDVLISFGVQVFEKEGFEADDIIGTIAHLAPKKQILPEVETIIISGDKDSFQLINKNTKVYSLRKGVKDIVLYDQDKVKEKYGISPSQLLDFKGLMGDPSDNIPGVFGIGEKTAISLIKEFNTLDNLYEALKEEKTVKISPRLKKTLIEQKDQAFLSRDLVEIKKDAPVDFNLKNSFWDNYNEKKAAEGLKKLEFHSLLSRLSNLTEKEEVPEKEEKPDRNLKLL